VRFLLDGCYGLLLLAAAPWLLYARLRYGKYREGLAQKLWGQVPVPPPARGLRIWMHAVSVGEVNLLATVLGRLEAEFPGCQCLISTTTQTAFHFARRRYDRHTVFYCPLDFSWAVDRAFHRLRPDVLLLVELELWPNLLGAAGRQGVPVALVNGRISDRSFRGYRRIRRLTRRWLRNVHLLAAQSEEDARRFAVLGAARQQLHVTGSLKFDGVTSQRDNPLTCRLRQLAQIGPDEIVLLAGSTQHPEEELAIQAFRNLATSHQNLRLVLVPRHAERFDAVAAVLQASGQKWQRRTALEHYAADSEARILLVDTIGELAGWWGVAHVAFVGGSLGSRGGQNMIEPAAYGAAVCFGPRTHNFRDVVAALLAERAAVVVRDQQELTEFFRRCVERPAYRQDLGQRAQRLVRQHAGAADRTVYLLRHVVVERARPLPAAHGRVTGPPAPKGPRHVRHGQGMRHSA
jgi:3-deoxy-D-manno-octulosonic-acid transferase